MIENAIKDQLEYLYKKRNSEIAVIIEKLKKPSIINQDGLIRRCYQAVYCTDCQLLALERLIDENKDK